MESSENSMKGGQKMYVNPFLMGVLATLGIELIALFICGVIKGIGEDRDN